MVHFTAPGAQPDVGRDTAPQALRRLLQHRTGHDLTVREVRWVSALRIRAAMADRFRIDRVFLAGDAAHTRGSGAGLPDRQTRTGPAGHRPHRPNRPHRHRGARTAVAA
ncbi:FAD-dependent monooxygenase [Streptomyces sp. NPDC001700]